jgi:hypothetical protein
MTDATDRTVPDEPPPDEYEWTSEEGDPDAAGMPAEFLNEPDEAVPGVRRSNEE